MILTILLTTALAVAACIIVALARTNLAYVERLTGQRRRIELLEQFIDSQRDRIDGLVTANGELEDRNACLERVQRKNLYNAVVSMPVMDVGDAVSRVTEISLN